MKLWYFVYLWFAIIKFSQSNELVNNTEYFRLPKTVIPEYYTLIVQTFLEKHNFKQISSVTILLRCIKPTKKITLHSRNLEITNVQLVSVQHGQMVKQYALEPEPYYFLHVYLNAYLVENVSYSLLIDFTAEIKNAMAGYYRSSYKDEKGQEKWIATTEFEPINARRAFPCFDEPALRARFSIQLGHRPHLTALSNMPLKYTQTDKEGWVWDTFEVTLNMPTYLVAYALHDFGFQTSLKSNRYGKTTVNVWAPKKSLQQVKFATELAPKLLSFFEEYFAIAYPICKSDMLAVPNYANGAMENWGLITYRESKLLYVPGISTQNDRYEIANTIAHETAHYWFGDLVTIRWWAYLWLKEGFATYLARVSVGHLYPDWEIYFTGTIINNMQAVYSIDALQSSRPVSVPIDDPNKIPEIYDSISYSKGSCIIRMMELFLGVDTLKKGLRHYLNKYKYGSTEPADLWYSLTIEAHKAKSLSENLDVSDIMDTWTSQPGYPIVTVVRDYTSGTVTVSQRRFLDNVKAYDQSCYWVPLTYTTWEECDFNSTKAKKWLPCPKKNITFGVNSKSWVLFNVQASGLYRVNYDKANWEMLINQLETNHQKIDKLNRVLLIDDVMQLATTDRVDYEIAFKLVRYIRHDDEFATWSRVLGKLMAIASFLDRTAHYGLIQAFISNLVTPVFKNFGGINQTGEFSKFQLLIIETACNVGNKDCEQQTADMYMQWMRSHGNYKIHEAIRGRIYCEGLKSGGEKEWDFLWQHYLKSDVATERDTILIALGCTEKQWLLVRYLEWMIKEDSDIKPQDSQKVYASVITNNPGAYIARLFFYEHVKEIYNIQSPKGKEMKSYLIMIANSLKTAREYDEYKTFMKQNKKYFKLAQLTTKQMLEKLVIWGHWNEKVSPKVVHALEQELQITNSRVTTSSTTPSITTRCTTPKSEEGSRPEHK